jgi:hypothetical protein
MNVSDAFRCFKHPRCVYVYLAIVMATYAIIKFVTLDISTGDEGVYYYFSSLWLDGFIPYRDFFYAHPPLHVLLSTAVMALVGINFTVLNTIPIITGGVSGVLVFCITRRALGTWTGLIACFLFLFSSVQLYESSHFTGMNLSVLFLLIGMMFFLRGESLRAGITLGVGTHVGVYVGIGFAVLFFVELWRKKIPTALFAGFSVSFGIIASVFFLYAGSAFMNQVFLYHFRKPEMSDFFAGKLRVILDNILWHPALVVLTIIGALFLKHLLHEWRKGHSDVPFHTLWTLLVSANLLAGYGIFLLFFQRIFYHYILLLIPFASILGAYTLYESRKLFTNKEVATVFCITLMVLHAGFGFYTYTKRNKNIAFISANVIAKEIEKEIDDTQTLFGNFAITPTLSLLSGRRIAAEEVDTSAMRFASGMSDLDEVIQKIENDNVGMILSQSQGGIGNYPPFREYLLKNFYSARTFQQNLVKGTPLIELWKRKQ